MRNGALAISILLTLTALVVTGAVFMGPTGFDLELLPLRSTRVLLGILAGASLGVTGCALQALLRNPLADPYILGVSGGAAAFGAAAIIFLPFSAAFVTPFASWLGSILVSMSLLYFLRHEAEHRRDRALLLGIAINAFASSFITVVKTLAPMRDTQTLLFWLIGNLSYVQPSWLALAYGMALPCLYILWRNRGTLEILKLGDEEALRLGANVSRSKRLIYITASCLVGVCVSMCGMIAFVGLVTPHMLRPLLGSDQRVLLPSSGLLGIILVTGVDTISRLSYSVFDTELPVGALLALFGAPVFVWILFQRGHLAHP